MTRYDVYRWTGAGVVIALFVLGLIHINRIEGERDTRRQAFLVDCLGDIGLEKVGATQECVYRWEELTK